ncbi:MAG TPA: alpha/beta hydrolase [Alphaproteobacteria bacterium]|nr:alpha/beta hydrolase [Alphaproteobacteria bacterium]
MRSIDRNYQRGVRDRRRLSQAFRPGGQTELYRYSAPRPRRAGGWLNVALATAAALGVTALFNAAAARRAERSNPPQGRFVTVEGVRLHYLEQGSGETVVFLHGNGAMAEDWIISDVMARAVAAGFRAIAFDRPGFGWSERPRGRDFSPEAQARLIAGACRKLELERPIIVAQSWGTMVAAALALDFASEVRGLVLIGGYYFPTARGDVLFFSPPAIPIIGDIMRYTISPLAGHLIAPLLYKKIFAPRPVPWRFSDQFPLSMALRPSQIRAAAADTALMIPAAARLRSRYFALGVPVVLMAGTGDRIADPGRQTMHLHRQLPNSVLNMVPGGGHMLHHLVPQQVVEAIRSVSRAEGQKPALAVADNELADIATPS